MKQNQMSPRAEPDDPGSSTAGAETAPLPAGASTAQGVSSPGMRRHNRGLILRTLLLHGPMARHALARAAGMTPATVSRISEELIRAELIRESDATDDRPRGAGRPAIAIELNPGGRYVLAAHIGATAAPVAIADLRSSLVAHRQVRLDRGRSAEEHVRAIARRALDLAAAAGVPRDRIVGMGIGSTGVVDPRGTIVYHPSLGWENVPVAALAAEVTGLHVTVDSTVRAIATAEGWFGRGRHFEPLAVVLLANVVAAATMVDRHPLLGANLIEGQIGHLPVGGDLTCACGRTGCLEVMVRDQTFLELAHRRGIIGPNRGVGAVYEAARSGDKVASELVAERGRLIARAVAVIDAVVNPAAVVFAGHSLVVGAGLLLPSIRAGLEDAMVLPEVRRELPLLPSAFGEFAAIVGASSLALRRLYAGGDLDAVV
jgi:predicted NBD/HSP70 family sugar kinase